MTWFVKFIAVVAQEAWGQEDEIAERFRETIGFPCYVLDRPHGDCGYFEAILVVEGAMEDMVLRIVQEAWNETSLCQAQSPVIKRVEARGVQPYRSGPGGAEAGKNANA